MAWEELDRAVGVRFGGRAEDVGAEAFVPGSASASWLRQVHSARVRRAVPGCVGEGDALLTGQRGLALVLVTADCVPVLLADPERIAAAHAGWRGIEAGIVAGLVARLRGPVRAWIGPHIGPCCYEVSEEVAERLVAVSSPAIRRDPDLAAGRPHIDLGSAVETQLRRAGVGAIRRLGPCTRCDARLWSYRRDGPGAGRNLSAIWRS